MSPPALKTLAFAFGKGLKQATDDRLLDPGTPRSVENLRIVKDGRLEMRLDYDSLGMRLQSGATLTLSDLVGFQNRLIGLGSSAGGSSFFTWTQAFVGNVFEYCGMPQFDWYTDKADADPQISTVAYPRLLSSIAGQRILTGQIDSAAGNDLLAMTWSTTNQTFAQILRCSTGQVQLLTAAGGKFLRCVCISNKFFFVQHDGQNVSLLRYDPATDTTLVSLGIISAGAAASITNFDVSLSHDKNSFWVGIARNTPATQILGLNSSGTVTNTIVGPAVLADDVTVLAENISGGTGRVHLALVINTTQAVNVSTYLTASNTLEHNTAAMLTGATGQVGLAVSGQTGVSAGRILVAFQKGSFISLRSYINSTQVLDSNATQIGQSTTGARVMSSKLLNVNGHTILSIISSQSSTGLSGLLSHLLIEIADILATVLALPMALGDQLFAGQTLITQLPNISFDAVTGKSYWPRFYLSTEGKQQPEVLEMTVGGTDRRQCAAIGDALYIPGGLVSTYDGRRAMESGFLTRPILTGSSTTGGSITGTGIYQIVAVFEDYDSHGNLVQSAPSDVVTVNMSGGTAIQVNVCNMYTFRNLLFSTIRSELRQPNLVIYRTRDTNNGNLTFFRDVTSAISIASVVQDANLPVLLTQSDTALSANAILYTQGQRGAISTGGILPFKAPEGCSSLAPSADRILGGALPSSAQIQESRPLFPDEQINWNDGIGFFRALRGQVLAVARLDERRLVFTAFEIFELEGAGVDDTGSGDIGAPRKLPSDVGLFGGQLGWRSMVECSLGILFQGTQTQLYLLARGGNTPAPVGLNVQSTLALFPNITAAVYVAQERSVYFACNNSGNTDSILIEYDIVRDAWLTHGPFGVPTQAAANFNGKLALLQSNVVRVQRASAPPAALIPNAWRSGSLHNAGLGGWEMVDNVQFYGEYRGDCAIGSKVFFDDASTPEIETIYECNALTIPENSNVAGSRFAASLSAPLVVSVGDPVSFKWTTNQVKSECVRIDFEVSAPFPNVIDGVALSTPFPNKVNSLSIPLSSRRAIGDRVVIMWVIMSASAGSIGEPAGFTVRSGPFTANGTAIAVAERILDGTEISPLALTWSGTAAAAYAIMWTIRNSHPTAPLELVANTTSAGSGTNSPLTPSWGAQNTLWLACLGFQGFPLFGQIPNSMRRGLQAGAAFGDANVDGNATGMDQALNAATFNLATWKWNSLAVGINFIIGIRPNPALASSAVAYHYWTMDVANLGGSARKSPLQMG